MVGSVAGGPISSDLGSSQMTPEAGDTIKYQQELEEPYILSDKYPTEAPQSGPFPGHPKPPVGYVKELDL